MATSSFEIIRKITGMGETTPYKVETVHTVRHISDKVRVSLADMSGKNSERFINAFNAVHGHNMVSSAVKTFFAQDVIPADVVNLASETVGWYDILRYYNPAQRDVSEDVPVSYTYTVSDGYKMVVRTKYYQTTPRGNISFRGVAVDVVDSATGETVDSLTVCVDRYGKLAPRMFGIGALWMWIKDHGLELFADCTALDIKNESGKRVTVEYDLVKQSRGIVRKIDK